METVTTSQQSNEPPAPTLTFSDRAALMVELGIPVIRLRPRSKVPLDSNWPDLATIDLEQIATWDRETPNANCGSVAKSDGFLFFESDEPGIIKRYQEETGESFQTFTAQSRPGRFHFYFRSTDKTRKVGSITQKELKFGSLRQHNAFVVSPLSVHPETGELYSVARNVPIIPAPDRFIEWLVEKKNGQQTQTQPHSTVELPMSEEETKAGIAAIFAAGTPIQHGGRNDGLTSVAGKFRNLGLGPAEIEEQLAKYNQQFCEPPLEASEVHTISYSIGKKPILDKVALIPLIGGKMSGTTVSAATPGNVPQLVEGVNEINGIKVESPINMTEVGNARRLIQSYGKNVRFCVDDGQWRLFDGSRWVIDKSELVEYLMKCVLIDIQSETSKVFDSVIPKEIRDSISKKLTKTGTLRVDKELTESELPWFHLFSEARELRSWAITSESNQKVRGSVQQAKSEPPMPAENGEFDKNRFICNLRNGTLEFFPDKASFTFRSHQREDFCTRMAPIDYVEGADCPEFKAFLRWMFSEDEEVVRYIQAYFGLCLTGIIERAILILFGEGANGKGALTKIISKLLGMDRSGYGLSVSFSTFAVGKEENPGSPRADLVVLDGPRFVVASESNKNKTKLNMALLKGFTGDDQTNTRGLYERDMKSFYAQCKILLQTNNLPTISDDSEGGWERLKLVPCKNQVSPGKQDKQLADRIFAKEASGILNFFIEGLMTYFSRVNQGLAGLEVPASVEEATESYKGTENHMAQFVEAECELTPHSRSALSTAVYQRYTSWCGENGEESQSNKALTQFIVRRYKAEIKHKRDGTHVLGLVLKPKDFSVSNGIITRKDTTVDTSPEQLPF